MDPDPDRPAVPSPIVFPSSLNILDPGFLSSLD
jgi:hypothetical protein